MIFSPEVLTLLILNILFLIFSCIAFILSVRIVLKWDINSTTSLQYNLEKQSFLASTIIKYILYVKIILFLFFIFTLDKISNVLSGAMCAAGVIDATSYGIYLILFKLINIYLFGFWIVLHKEDSKTKDLRYTPLKFGFFLFIFFLLFSEIAIETTMFSSIDVNKLVSCCGTLYSSSSKSYLSSLFLINQSYIIGSFYGCFFSLILFYFLKNSYFYAIFNLLFLILSLFSLVSFFGTYIYELPTHHCPFCILQKEYSYIGYFLYTLLFLGTFFGLNTLGEKLLGIKNQKGYFFFHISIVFIVLFTLILSFYPLKYYLTNGVWL